MRHHWQQEMLKAIAPRYRKAGRVEKSKILDEFCLVTGFHRKYAIRLLKHPPRPRLPRRLGRPSKTDSEAERILVLIWRKSGFPSSRKLAAALPKLLDAARRQIDIPLRTRRQLANLSPRTIDRRLRPHRERLARHGDPFREHRKRSGVAESKKSYGASRQRPPDTGHRLAGSPANRGNKSFPGATNYSRIVGHSGSKTSAEEPPRREESVAIEMSTRKQKGAMVISVRGELVLTQEHFALMKMVLKELKEGEDRFVIDLGKVTKMDSAGVGELVAVNVAVKEKGGRVHLANFEEDIGKVLQMALIHKIIPSFDTQKEAIEAFGE